MRHARGLGDVDEAPVGTVAVEPVRPERGDVQVGSAVVVVVAYDAAHAPFRAAFETHLLRDVDEGRRAVIVAVQGVARAVAPGEEVGPRRSVDQEHVEVAVKVVVEQAHAARHRVGQVALDLGGARAHDEIHAAGGGDVLEAHARPHRREQRRQQHGWERASHGSANTWYLASGVASRRRRNSSR